MPTSYEAGFFKTYAQYVGEQHLGVDLCDAMAIVREDCPQAELETPSGWIAVEMKPSLASRVIKIGLVVALIAGAVAWFAWQPGHAVQANLVNADEVPIQFTMNLSADD